MNLEEVGYIEFDILKEFIFNIVGSYLERFYLHCCSLSPDYWNKICWLVVCNNQCYRFQEYLISYGRGKSGRTYSTGIFNVKLAVFVVSSVLFSKGTFISDKFGKNSTTWLVESWYGMVDRDISNILLYLLFELVYSKSSFYDPFDGFLYYSQAFITDFDLL